MTKTIQLSPETVANVRDAVFALAEQHLDAPFCLVAVDFEKESGHWYLRLYVDKPGNDGPKVSLQDCETVSRTLDESIETIKALRDFPYILEVSSPGAFRPLTTAREFEFYKNRLIKIERPLKSNPKRTEVLTGILGGFIGDALTLVTPDGPQAVTLTPETQVYLNPPVPHLSDN